jgi:hypothetical protein
MIFQLCPRALPVSTDFGAGPDWPGERDRRSKDPRRPRRHRAFARAALLVGVLAAVAASPARAAVIKVSAIRAYVFLEHSGHLSEDLVAQRGPLRDVPSDTSPLKEPASNLLIDITFASDPGTTPKYADVIVNLIQTGRNDQKIVTKRALGHFSFGADGIDHKSIMLEDGVCMPLEIEVKAGKSVKTAKLEFGCPEKAAAQ